MLTARVSLGPRDNPYHSTAILGGMWGARMDTGLREVLDTAMRNLISDVRTDSRDIILVRRLNQAGGTRAWTRAC